MKQSNLFLSLFPIRHMNYGITFFVEERAFILVTRDRRLIILQKPSKQVRMVCQEAKI